MTDETETALDLDSRDLQVRELAAKTFWEGAFKTNTMIRGFEVKSDEPIADFGSNEYPAPAEIFLGAVGACLTSSYAWAAFTSRLRLHAITTTLNGRIEPVGDSAKITSINITLKVNALSNKPDKLERCFKIAMKKCMVLNSIDCEKKVDFKLKITDE